MRFRDVLAILVGTLLLGCAGVRYTAEDCKADIDLLKLIAQEVISAETDDLEKLRKRVLYAEIAGRVVARGCNFVPPPEPEDLT